MKPEEKTLLLKDLCARLPYGVKVRYHYKRKDRIIDEDRELDFSDVETLKYNNTYPQDDWCEISWKPYLRQMSSMTEEEAKEFEKTCFFSNEIGTIETIESADWLNEHHFDHRGLIPMGLALEAKEGMYK